MPHYRKLYAFALSILADESEAADCLQEAMTRLWENRSRLAQLDNVEAYAVVTVRNVAISSLSRRKNVFTNIPEIPPDIPDENPSPAESIEAREKLEMVSELMSQLPDNQRRVVMLSAVSGLSNREIKETTGLSDDNVRVLLSRGRRKLKELFSKIYKDEKDG